MKRIFSLVIFFTCFVTIQAQYVGDALRYSQNFPTLSARSLGMGGAFTSLGGDYSSSYINPAGLAMYRKSEFVISPGLQLANNNADYLGESNKDYRYQFNFSNLGYVGTWLSKRDKGLVSASYSIGYNRLNNYHNNLYIGGVNNNSSYSDYFVEYASVNEIDPIDLDDYYERLLYDAWIIDYDGSSSYYSLVPVPVEQQRTIRTKGGAGEWSFAFGLNFSDRIYWGMGLGIDQFDYRSVNTHREINHGSGPFKSFDFTEELNVEGVGFTMNTGIIARLGKFVRIGTSIHLPTYYRITEDYFNTAFSDFGDSTFYKEPTDDNGNYLGSSQFRYRLRTPFQWNSGVSFMLGTKGIISADVNYINYSRMQMKTHPDFDNVFDRQTAEFTNEDIEMVYRPVVNLKLGGEVRLMEHFSLRLGGGYYPSVYASDELNEAARHFELNSGVGYRSNSFFVDFAFSGLFHTEKYNLYFDNISDIKANKYRFVASMGVRF